MEFSIDDLPEPIADRVRAATGEAQYLTVRRAGEWVVEALTGDRVTFMRLHVRDDGSVAEETDSFLLGAIQSIDNSADALVTARTGERQVTLPVSSAFAAALASRLASRRGRSASGHRDDRHRPGSRPSPN